jgi:8-oxo-dGTP diphosphatase
VRDRNLPDREVFVCAAITLAHRYGVKVLVNGGPAIGDGTHFSASDLMKLSEKPERGLAAASCHTRAELEHAMRLGLDFAVLGPVKATATHPDAALLGWDGFARIARGASIPVYAIGGLRPADLDEARRHGAHGLAMIRGSWG